jgi:hypothetical protein
MQAPLQPKPRLSSDHVLTSRPKAQPRSVLASRSLASLLFFSLLWLANTTFWPFDPQKVDFMPAKLDAKGRAQRIADFVYSNENPSVIFLGTSLIFRASFQCDAEYEKLRVPADPAVLWHFKREYVGCQHFARLLSQALEKQLTASEFGIPASMVSDSRQFVEKLGLFKKTPKLVICTLAPRDLFDNVYKDPEETTGWEQISTCYPTSLWFKHPIAAWFYLIRRWAPAASVERKIDVIKSRAFTYRYNFEQFLRKCVLKIAHESTLPSVAAPTANSQQASTPTHNYADLAPYQFCYNPPDYDEFTRNSDELRKTAELCHQFGYPLVLVDMPVTPENRSQMMPEALARYRKTIQEISKAYKLELIVPDNATTYDASDFVDSVHLTAPGADKFFHYVVTRLGANQQIRSGLVE